MEKLTLYQLTEQQQQIEDLLIENGGELTPEIEQLMESTSEALAVKVDGYNHIIRRLEGFAASAKAEKERLAKLQKVAENGVKAIKAHIADVMQAQGISKLESATCKIGFRRTESVAITDEELLLRPYRHTVDTIAPTLPEWVKVSIDIDKTALKAYIKAGHPVLGAEVEENQNIQIR